MQRGGAEMRTLEVMRSLRPLGFICDVVALSGLAGELDTEIEALGGRVHFCRRTFGWRRHLRRILRSGGYTVVHSHVHLYSGILLREAAHCGIPIRIAHFRSTGDGRGNNLVRRCYRWLMTRLIDRHATAILSVSRSALTAAWPRPTDARCQVIYNGLDLKVFSRELDVLALRADIGVPVGAGRVVMHVGNFTQPKNHGFLLRVFAALAKKDQSLYLILVGRGGTIEEQQTRALIEEFSLGGQVKILGVRDDVPDLLRCADVFLFPSVREGLPGALLEACAAGLPCVTSDIPSCREVAERVPGVDCVGLDQPVSVWVERLQRGLASGRASDPQAGSRHLIQGGFDLDTATEALRRAWTVPVVMRSGHP
ncbi:MAG: glycosyltransferase [Planctomycetes bacterium]|nr:glycosyltransferase [Planctomycetota bacterium]